MSKKKQPKTQEEQLDLLPQCITEACEQPMRWKGLCSHCYGQAKTLIDLGRTTWDELFQLGLALDDRPFMIAFELAKKE